MPSELLRRVRWRHWAILLIAAIAARLLWGEINSGIQTRNEQRIDRAAKANFPVGTPTSALLAFVSAEHGECQPDNYSPFGVPPETSLYCTIPFSGFICVKRYYWISAKLSADRRSIEAMRAREAASYC